MTKQLMPMVQPSKDLISKDGTINIKYLAGYPRQYRFDANKGFFNVKGHTPLTKKGETLTIVPIAFRVFSDDILGMGRKKWAEFFFLNDSQQLCGLLLHGYSVQNLERDIDEMFYDGVSFCNVALTITPVEKVSKQVVDGKNPKYFLCGFTYQVLDKKTQETMDAVVEGLQIWRDETLTGDAVMHLSCNFNPPIKSEELQEPEAQPEVATA